MRIKSGLLKGLVFVGCGLVFVAFSSNSNLLSSEHSKSKMNQVTDPGTVSLEGEQKANRLEMQEGVLVAEVKSAPEACAANKPPCNTLLDQKERSSANFDMNKDFPGNTKYLRFEVLDDATKVPLPDVHFDIKHDVMLSKDEIIYEDLEHGKTDTIKANFAWKNLYIANPNKKEKASGDLLIRIYSITY